MGVVLILDKKRDGRIVLFSIFALLVGSILVVGAVSVNNNQTKLIINDIVAVDKFNHLKGFKQIGFTIDYDNIAIESFNKEILATSGNNIRNKFSSGNIEVESIYEEIDTSFFNVDERPIKQIYILRNLLNTNKNVKLNILYEIDSDFVVWNGTEYAVSNEPIYFEAFEVTEEIFPGLNETYLTGYILTFGNNYYDFKDIVDLNYTISVYSLNNKNYINLEINQEIEGLQEFVIDPVIGWTDHIIAQSANDPNSVFAIDLDNDGDNDILSASTADDKIAWYENNGSSPPGWTTHIITTSADSANTVYAIDMDNDNDIDVLSSSGGDNRIAWYKNDGNSPPSWTTHNISNTVDASSLFAIDMDNDNDIDVIGPSTAFHAVEWYENEGNSLNWTAHNISTSVNRPLDVYAIDVDGDGDVDVLSASELDDRIGWYENNGSSPPNWTSHNVSTSADRPFAVFAIDIDGDADVDVLSASTNDDTIAWYENDGGSPPGWTDHNITTSADSAGDVYAIDIDNDNDIDVIGAHNNGYAWYENNGSSPPNWIQHNISNALCCTRSVYAIGIDNDNDIDVLTATQTFGDDEIKWHESNLTPANTTDLEILEIIPIQVVRDVDMVKDKSGIVRVVVKNNGPLDANATVDVTFEGDLLKDWDTDSLTSLNKTINVNMNESFDFRFKPAQTGTQTFSAEVSVS